MARTQWDEVAAQSASSMQQADPPRKAGPVVTRVLPTVDDDPDELAEREIQYDATPEGSFVLSGPLPHGGGPGRPFQTAGDARRFWKDRGYTVVERIRDAEWGGRWALRVLPPVKPDYRIAEEVL